MNTDRDGDCIGERGAELATRGLSNRAALTAVVVAFSVGIVGSLAIRPITGEQAQQHGKTADVEARISWRVPVVFQTNLPVLDDNLVYVAHEIDAASGGAIKIRLYEPGEIVPAFSITDAVRDNKVEAGYTWLGYDQGKIPASALLAAVPFGMEPWEFSAWWSEAGGREAVVDLFKTILPPAFLILSVLGSVFFGLATSTEAAGVGALGALLLALFKGALNMAGMRDVLQDTTRSTAYIFAIMLGATAFSLVWRGIGGHELIEGWFTVLFAICLQTSFLTPPVGLSIFFPQGCSASGNRYTNHLSRGGSLHPPSIAWTADRLQVGGNGDLASCTGIRNRWITA